MDREALTRAVEAIAPRFRSGNRIPVDKATVPASEWNALLEAATPAMTMLKAPANMCSELDLVLTDPDSSLSDGARRTLLWLRTWISVPLYAAPSTAKEDGNG